jgi:hypothetical protein
VSESREEVLEMAVAIERENLIAIYGLEKFEEMERERTELRYEIDDQFAGGDSFLRRRG